MSIADYLRSIDEDWAFSQRLRRTGRRWPNRLDVST